MLMRLTSKMRVGGESKAVHVDPLCQLCATRLWEAALYTCAAWSLFIGTSTAIAAEASQAVRIAVVDLAVAAEKMPEKKEVETRVQTQIEALDREVQVRWKVLEKLNEDFKTGRKVLSAEAQAEQQAIIIRKEKEIGEYWTKRSEEIKRSATEGTGVFSDLIRSSIAEMARQQGFDLVFDKENGRLLHANDRFDHTQELLEILKRVSKSSSVPKSSGAGATNTPPLRDSHLKTP